MMKRSTIACVLLVMVNITLGSALLLIILGVIPLPARYSQVRTVANSSSSTLAPLDGHNRVRIRQGSTSASLANQSRTVSLSEQENIQIYSKTNEGVVNITTEVTSYSWFLEPIPRPGSTGSGSIIDKSGHVLTNHHVIKNATNVFVTLANGELYPAEVIGVDVENDIAIIKFTPSVETPPTIIPFGSSRDLQIGLKVLAIGNPFGLDRTLTTGIISGLNRPVRVSKNLVVNNMIQTDASINPGNSGGPLLDSAGNMVGINSAIFSPNGGSTGIGFAVPSDTAKRVIPELIASGTVRRGWIDVVPRQLFPQLVQYAELSVNRGVLISELEQDSNAAAAGLRGGSRKRGVGYGGTVIYLGGDIIVGVGIDEVSDIASLYAALERTKPGQAVTVRYVRNETEREARVVLAERPKQHQWD